MLNELKSLIKPALTKFHIQKKFQQQLAIYLWDKIFGEEIFKNSQPTSIKNGVLFVKAKNPAWAFELSKLKIAMLEKLNQEIGKKTVRDIKFSTGTLRKKTHRPINTISLDMATADISGGEQKEIKRLLDSIYDDSLRLCLQKLLFNAKKLEKTKKDAGWKKCQACSTLSEGNRLCFFCRLVEQEKKQKKIYALLWETPWLSFAEAKKNIPEITADTYMRCKSKLIDSLYGAISFLSLQLQKNTNSSLAEDLKNKLLAFIMFKTGLPPSKLTDLIIKTILDKNLPTKIRKKIPFF